MLSDFFRSESEHSATFADSTGRCVSNYADQDTTVFYSVQYEEDLLMRYIGESTGIGESVNESDAELSNFDPFISGELPSYAYIDPTQSPICFPDSSSLCNDVHADCELKITYKVDNISGPISHQQPSKTVSHQKSSSRRGRPMKITSTSKMAKYARNYREQKKNQLLACEAQIKELTEENKFLRSENKRLTEGFARLTDQVNNLRKFIERNSYTYQDPLQTPFNQCSYEKDSINDISDVCDLMAFPQ